MMLKYSFQMDKAAEILEEAISRAFWRKVTEQKIYIKEGDTLVTTEEMTNKVIENFEKIFDEQALGVFTYRNEVRI